MAFNTGSLRVRSIIYITLMLTVLGGILTGVSITQQRNILHDELKKRGIALAESLAGSSTLNILLQDSKSIEKLATEAGKDDDVSYIFVEDSRGELLVGKEKEKINIPGTIFRAAANADEPGINSFPAEGVGLIYEVVVPVVTAERVKEEELDMFSMAEPESKKKDEVIFSGQRKIGLIRIGFNIKSITSKVALVIRDSVLLMLLVVLTSIFFTIAFFTRTISEPIRKLILIVIAAAEKGDLTKTIEQQSGEKDEIGQLSAAFNKLIKSLAFIVGQIRTSSDKITVSSQDMSTTTQNMNTSTVEISGAIQNISKQVSNQADCVGQTYEKIERASTNLKEIVANAQSVSATVDKVSVRVKSGQGDAQEAVKKINHLTRMVEDTSKVMQELGVRSQQIGEITDTITRIADQTNLLALNAAIEAARAGDAGRGFAVVAEEVRKLAEGSAAAVRKISQIIKSIQSETQLAVTSIDKSSNEVKEGSVQVSKIADVLAEMNSAINEANILVKQIASAGQHHLQETEQIVESVNKVAEIANKAASATQEISSTAEEQTAAMQQIAAAAQELTQIAMSLKEVVNIFHLGEMDKK